MIDKPLITVIVAVHNAEETIQKCIDSVVSQTYEHKELIIIDGNSSDNTVNIIKSNQGHIDYWISEPDTGIYSAWNKGLAHVKGEWICFLGADDYFWDDQVLIHIVNKLVDLPSKIRVAYGKVMLVNPNGEQIYTVGKPWEEVKKIFTYQMVIPHPGAMHHSELFKQHGNFNESFRVAGDYELLLRELKNADAYFISNLIVAGMQIGGISGNPGNSLPQLIEVRKAQKLNGLRYPSLRWVFAVLRAYIRAFLWELLGESKTRILLDWGRAIMGQPPYWTRN